MVILGFGTSEWVPQPLEYAFKEDDGSSHSLCILDMRAMARPDPRPRLLRWPVPAHARAAGHHGDRRGLPGYPGRAGADGRVLQASLEDGMPAEAGDDFDVIVAADIIEHLSRPGQVLRDMCRVLRPGGQVMLSVPNFAHWYPRTRVALGIFGYDRRGILDETHLRFFTRATLRRLVRASGYDVVEERLTGLPLRAISESDGPRIRIARKIDAALVCARPTLFGYQNILRLTPHAQDTVHVEVI